MKFQCNLNPKSERKCWILFHCVPSIAQLESQDQLIEAASTAEKIQVRDSSVKGANLLVKEVYKDDYHLWNCDSFSIIYAKQICFITRFELYCFLNQEPYRYRYNVKYITL